ncbi:hypothetical protein LUW77_25850 [Streptomyces radiopugnans]|nr:hypothetical protein LUW77_25850 [Streptomyces radiopugnans]
MDGRGAGVLRGTAGAVRGRAGRLRRVPGHHRDPRGAALRPAGLSDPPDVAVLPVLGDLVDYEREGFLEPLGEGVVDEEKYDGGPWLAQPAGMDERHWIPVKVDLKSIVWHEKGRRPDPSRADAERWCVGMGSDATSGWPGSDWIEDVLLQQSGHEAYEEWAAGEMEWTEEAVVRAWRTWGEFMSGDGGRTAREALTTDHRGPEGGNGLLFGTGPGGGCELEHQGSFARHLYGPRAPEADFVPSPRLLPGAADRDGRDREVSADFAAMFRASPEGQELMRFLASPEAQRVWAKDEEGWARGEIPFFSAHEDVGEESYPHRRQGHRQPPRRAGAGEGGKALPGRLGRHAAHDPPRLLREGPGVPRRPGAGPDRAAGADPGGPGGVRAAVPAAVPAGARAAGPDLPVTGRALTPRRLPHRAAPSRRVPPGALHGPQRPRQRQQPLHVGVQAAFGRYGHGYRGGVHRAARGVRPQRLPQPHRQPLRRRRALRPGTVPVTTAAASASAPAVQRGEVGADAHQAVAALDGPPVVAAVHSARAQRVAPAPRPTPGAARPRGTAGAAPSTAAPDRGTPAGAATTRAARSAASPRPGR